MQVTYDSFIQQWNGNQVTDFDGQCVALIAKFCQENNLPILYANANQYADAPLMHENFDWVANDPNDPNQLPERGDIVVWDGSSPYSGGNGHIAFFDHQLEGHQFMSFGQNSGGPTAHFQPHSWNHVAGWWHYREAAPAPEPYTLTDIAPKLITINRDTHRWNMGYADLQQMKDNPIETLHTGQGPYTVTVQCHQNATGYDYYLENRNNLGGFNIYDCSDYTPPVEPPAPVSQTYPSGPLNANSPTYKAIIKDIPGYLSATNAANHTNQVTTVRAGSDYYLFTSKYGMDNVTLMTAQPGAWINPSDNVPDPIPEPTPEPQPITLADIKPTWEPPVEVAPEPTIAPDYEKDYKPFNKAVWYKAVVDTHVLNLTSGVMSSLTEGRELPIHGTLLKDGILYGRATKANSTDWFVVPLVDLTLAPNKLHKLEAVAHSVLEEPKYLDNLQPFDHLSKSLHQTERFIDKVWDVFFKKPKAKK